MSLDPEYMCSLVLEKQNLEFQRNRGWRKEGDSNPRYPLGVRQFSKLLVSATHPSFLKSSANVLNYINLASRNRKKIQITYIFSTIAVRPKSMSRRFKDRR